MNTYSSGLIVFTDGSSRGNPGPGGWGTIIIDIDTHTVTELAGAKDPTTNNEMELLALYEGLCAIHDPSGPLGGSSSLKKGEIITLHIYLDSSYVRQGATQWIYGWQKNNWMTKTKEPVSHQELWKKVYTEIVRIEKDFNMKIVWHHMPGHSGLVGNERADELATLAADGLPLNLYMGALGTYPIQDILNIPSDEELQKKRENKSRKKTTGAAGGWYISLVDGVLKKHITWKECEDRVKGTKGAKFKKVGSEEEEKEFINKWS